MEEMYARREPHKTRTVCAAAGREDTKRDTAEIEDRINLPIPHSDEITQHPDFPTFAVASTAACIEAMSEGAAELIQRITPGTWQGNIREII
jgi:hypothetical protein